MKHRYVSDRVVLEAMETGMRRCDDACGGEVGGGMQNDGGGLERGMRSEYGSGKGSGGVCGDHDPQMFARRRWTLNRQRMGPYVVAPARRNGRLRWKFQVGRFCRQGLR